MTFKRYDPPTSRVVHGVNTHPIESLRDTLARLSSAVNRKMSGGDMHPIGVFETSDVMSLVDAFGPLLNHYEATMNSSAARVETAETIAALKLAVRERTALLHEARRVTEGTLTNLEKRASLKKAREGLRKLIERLQSF